MDTNDVSSLFSTVPCYRSRVAWHDNANCSCCPDQR